MKSFFCDDGAAGLQYLRQLVAKYLGHCLCRPDYLNRSFAVESANISDASPAWALLRPGNWHMRLADAVAFAERHPSQAVYMNQVMLPDLGAKALQMLRTPAWAKTLKLVQPSLWLTADVALTGFHTDGPENLLAQLSGSKELTLLRPSEQSKLAYEGRREWPARSCNGDLGEMIDAEPKTMLSADGIASIGQYNLHRKSSAMKRKAPTHEPGRDALEIRKAASGELLLAVSSEDRESFRDVRALKRFLQPLCGLPRFRQRLLYDGQVMQDDDAVPAAPGEVQLVLLNFCKPDPESEAELHDAAFVGSIPRVEAVLQRPEDPNADGIGDSPLTAAAYSGQIDVVRLLLEARADTGLPEDESQTPLEAASELGYQDIVRLLLESRADGGIPRVTLETPIWLAASSGHEEIVRLLLQAGAPTESSYDDGETPLLQACERGHLATAEVLLNSNADVNTRGEGGRTPLREACEGGHLNIVRLLSKAGGDAHAADDLGRTPLAAAEQQGHSAVDVGAMPKDVPPELLKSYNEAEGALCHLRAGDVLYIPAQWHHAVLTVPDESCIALSLNLWYHRIDDVEAVGK
eukprot:s3864_g1.t7